MWSITRRLSTRPSAWIVKAAIGPMSRPGRSTISLLTWPGWSNVRPAPTRCFTPSLIRRERRSAQCDTLNAPSCAAAQRYGFSFEGAFCQSNVVKGRTRDSAWFSVLDSEWPALRVAYERWLAAENFAADRRQHVSLSSLTAPLLKAKFMPGFSK